MIKAGQLGIGLVMSAWALISPQATSAQYAPPPPPASTTNPATALGIGNPYMNPALNPYLNPAITQQPMNGSNALLYLYAANTARGGIGSGQLSNPPTTRGRSRAAELPDSVSRPGGGAARFFNPGPVNVNGAGRYYNQRGRYFNNNGR
jgi:hypothetical protein